MPCHCSTSHPLVITGSAEQIRDVLCGPPQHNEHCKGWRWHLYVQDDVKRQEAVMEALHKLHANRRAYMTSQQRADIELAEWRERRSQRA